MIAWVPTLVFALAFLLQVLLGVLRGKRKSFILFINFIIAFALSAVVFYTSSSAINSIGAVDALKDALGVLNGDTISEVLAFYLLSSMENSLIGNISFEVVVMMASIVLKLLVFIVIQLIIYRLIKFVLWIIYMIAFRRRVREDNEDFGKGVGMGALIGSIRGVIIGFILFSQVSTLFFVLSGGIYYTSEEYDKEVQKDIFFGYDEYYKGLKTSRNTGLGLIFEKIKIGGTPIDYLFMDAVMKEDFTNYNDKSISYLGREELGYTVGVITRLYETGVVSMTDGNFSFDPSKATPEVIESVFNNLSGLKTITEVVPTLLVNYEGDLDGLFVKIDKEMLKEIKFAADIKGMASILCTLVQMVDFSNFEDFGDIDIWGFEDELVDKLIDDISKLTILTKVAIPLGLDSLFGDLEGLVFDFSSIFWEDDLKNLKGLYTLVKELELDFDAFGDMEYIESLLADEEKVAIIDKVIDKIFTADFTYEVATSYLLNTLNKLSEDIDIVASLNFDVEDYTKEELKADISLLLDTVVEGFSIYELISSGDFTVEKLFEMDLTPLENCLVGTFNDKNEQIKDGIMDLNILKNADDDFYGSLFSMIPQFSELIGDVVIEDWRTEFRTMFDTISVIQELDLDINGLLEGDLTALPTFTLEQENKLVSSIHGSTIVSTMFVGLLTDTLSGIDMITIPDDVEWYGEGEELDSLLRTVIFFVNKGVIDSLMGGNSGAIMNALLDFTEADFNKVCNSLIIHSTLSEQIKSLTEGTPIIIADEAFTNGLINISELTLLLEFLEYNFYDSTTGTVNFDNIDFDEMYLFTSKNIEIINKSVILSRTIVSTLTDMGDFINIPSELSDYSNDAWYGNNGELNALLGALQPLFYNKPIGGLTFDFDELIEQIFNSKKDGKYPLFDSVVMRATMSQTISALGGSSFLIIPASVNETVYGTSMIKSAELTALLDGLNALDLTNYTDFNDIYTKLNSTTIAVAVESTILHHTLSNQLATSLNYVVTEYGDDIVVVNGVVVADEITALIKALETLGLTNLSDLSVLGTSILDNISSQSDIDIILESSIMSAILSSLVTAIPGHNTTSQAVLGGKPNVNIYSKESLNTILGLLLTA